MPEVNDFQLHLQGVNDLLLQRSSNSNQGCFSRCYKCNSGVKSEFFAACLDCREILQDGKPGDAKAAAPPLLVEAVSYWGDTTHNIAVPIAAPTVPEDHVPVPFATSSARVTKPRSPNLSRDHHLHLTHGRSSCRSPTSPYRTLSSQRGRPPNGSRQGPKGFTGVRQRKGVRGFLVEIRPPKWRRTIWLGTYSTDREAAGAYDAGVFYTKKKTKYNFPALEGTFPPLPDKLRLDNDEHSEAIKHFVQKEARLASQKVKTLAPAVHVPTESSTTSVVTNQSVPAVDATSGSSSDCDATTSTSDLVLPLDEDWFQHLSLFDEFVSCGNVSFQLGGSLSQSWQMMNPFELKQVHNLDQEDLL